MSHLQDTSIEGKEALSMASAQHVSVGVGMAVKRQSFTHLAFRGHGGSLFFRPRRTVSRHHRPLQLPNVVLLEAKGWNHHLQLQRLQAAALPVAPDMFSRRRVFYVQ